MRVIARHDGQIIDQSRKSLVKADSHRSSLPVRPGTNDFLALSDWNSHSIVRHFEIPRAARGATADSDDAARWRVSQGIVGQVAQRLEE